MKSLVFVQKCSSQKKRRKENDSRVSFCQFSLFNSWNEIDDTKNKVEYVINMETN